MQVTFVRWVAVGWLALLAGASSVRAAGPQDAARVEFFESRVRPLLVQHCVKCHGPEKQESDLRLDDRAAALRGGLSGAAVVPGRPDESLLVAAVRFEGLEMPPDGRLADDEIAALEQWVRDGAVWPGGARQSAPALGDQEAIRRAAREHWAFQPVRRPAVPAVAEAAWVATPVDAFVLARLTEAGLRPSPAADPRTLLRRLSFDLVGLPPEPAALSAFVAAYEAADEGDPARARAARQALVARTVEELLASPQYGERWGRHWLDVARYADTRDFIAAGIDRRYPFAYTYRDWVVRALNADLPYDEFIRQQLAADFYTDAPGDPNLAALGLLTVGPRFQNDVNQRISDQIDVVGRGFLGLAVTCARCHDHKYDPVPTADYYALYGVFASCQEPAEYPILAGQSPPPEQVADYERKRQEALDALAAYGARLRDEAEADLWAKPVEYLLGYYEMELAKSESIRSLLSKRKLQETAMTPLAANLSRLTRDAKRHNDPIWGPLLHQLLVVDKNFQGHLGRKLKTGLTGDADPQPIHPAVLAALREAQPADKRALLETYGKLLERVGPPGAAPGKKAGGKPAADGDPELASLRAALAENRGPLALEPDACVAASRLQGKGRTTLAQFENAIKDVDATHPGAPARAFMVEDKPRPVEPVVFLRGDPQRRGDRVDRRFLTFFSGDKPQPFTEGSGRRELAEAIADPRNPLTARVAVNRVWMHHFGQGIVATPGDFGLRADPPSHPELLDWLAAEFVAPEWPAPAESGAAPRAWSLKHLHRLICLSSTYAQSSGVEGDEVALAAAADKPDPASEPAPAEKSAGPADKPAEAATHPELAALDPRQIDPDNRLLWRQNRRRLDFESMRDAMLAAAGRLDRTVGGRSVDLSERPYSTRRTLYGFIDRLNLDPIFTTFDFASPEVSTPARSETMVPQQALFGMNHPFVIEQARQVCRTAEFTAAATDAERLAAVYGRVLEREPSAAERALAEEFLRGAAAPAEEAALARGGWQYGYGAADPDAPAEDRFHPLPVYTGREYQAGPEYPDRALGHARLTKSGGHPGRNQELAVVRRWVAPRKLVVDVAGEVAHLSDKGDGVRARLIGPKGTLLGEWIARNERVDAEVRGVAVEAGETLDFVVDCRTAPTADAFTWAPTITAAKAGPTAAGDATAGMAGPTAWDAAADFAPPPPPLLSPWEQLAQALLLTNEFLFID